MRRKGTITKLSSEGENDIVGHKENPALKWDLKNEKGIIIKVIPTPIALIFNGFKPIAEM